MSSFVQNFSRRVLSVDQEQSSFVPIVGLDKAPDLPVLECLMFAWRACGKLHGSISEDDLEVLLVCTSVPPVFFLFDASARQLQPARACTS
jgi:hypothetical protein